MRLLLVALLLCVAAPTWAGIPGIIINTETTGKHAFICPAGTGPSFPEQGIEVRVQLLDVGELPIEHFPFQDIWISSFVQGEITLCVGGSSADANTDSTGWTRISGPVAGGGYTTAGTMVFVNGEAADYLTPLPIEFSSPDFDRDLDVDLVDFSAFGADFGTTNSRSDFEYDGVVDLADFSIFGRHYFEQCP